MSSQVRKPDGLGVIAVSVAAVALLGMIFAVAISVRAVVLVDRHGKESVVTASVPVALSEFKIGPATITATADAVLQVTNKGSAPHNLTVKGTKLATPDIQPGKSATLDMSSLADGEHTVICTLPGHEGSGMIARLNITSTGGATPTSHDAGPSAMAADHMDEVMAARTAAFPAKTSGIGAREMPAKVLADGTKEFALTASVFEWEVEPNKIVEAWGYNKQVPGPTIRVGVGDKVRIVLTNGLPESTVLHAHGLLLPNAMDGVPDITQKPIKPGETFVYEFTTREAMVGMYHSHHDAAKQVTNGMLGAFYVGDMPLPVGTPRLALDVPMILNDAGTIGFSLNGKSFPATAPLVAEPGDWVKVDYMNEGLQTHPMHLHGMPQLVIAKDGYPQSPHLEDTVVVAPGERISVLVHATEVGTWAWHCHILTHAEREDGMFGMVTALVVAAPSDGSQNP